jgi:5-methylthioadenosine/S-adenosylhomocysteine deaminase
MSAANLSALNESAYALAPDIILAPEGPVRDHVLAVSDGKIEAVVPLSAYTAKFPARAVTRLPGVGLIPGFIDAHTHLGQTFGKAYIGGEPSQIWLRIWGPLEQAQDPHRSYVAAKWMCLEALRGGYTTLVNYCLNTPEKNEGVLKAARETGIRLVSATGLDTLGDDAEATGQTAKKMPIGDTIARLEEHIAACAAHPTIYPSLCCNGYFGSSLDTIAAVAEYCAGHGVLFQMHSNEHFPEVHGCIIKFGKRPIELWSELGVLGPQTLLHHATLTSEREIELLRESQTAISYNPVASQWKGNAVAPALAYVERGVRMGLGTDATRMDAFRTLDAAESCQRIAHGLPIIDFSCGAGWTWVDIGTRGSADVCGLADKTGALAAGLAADFLLLNLRQPEVVPSWDFEWELVRFYNRDQIEAVVVDGKPVMKSGHPVGWDADRFVAENAGLATSTLEGSGAARLHGPSGKYRAQALSRPYRLPK